jgi:chromosomal replication initiation ATPase DnaA
MEAGIILGSGKFKTKVMEFLGTIEAHEELPQIKRLRERVPIDRIIKTCSSFYDKKEADLLKRGKDNRERQIAIYLSKILSGKKNIEVGRFFGVKGPAVSGAIKAIEGRLDKEKKLKKAIEGLKERLIND